MWTKEQRKRISTTIKGSQSILNQSSNWELSWNLDCVYVCVYVYINIYVKES